MEVPTLVLLRRPLVPSIQMYSARTLPFWSSFMYLANWESVRDTASDLLGVGQYSHWRHWRQW